MFGIIKEHMGRKTGILGLVLFPVTLILGPLWAGFVHSTWLPMLLVYGGAVLAGGFISSSTRDQK